jgi:23S rRNA (pseudouridine1915-N3)-methyltransferase
MSFTVIAVGRDKKSVHKDLFDFYRARLPDLDLIEVPTASREAEGESLLNAVPRQAFVIALDERGKALSSPDLARHLDQWRVQGHSRFVFIIGGADGLSDAVRARADFTLSLGAMVWPHLLVRGMLAEQLYRAESILAGHPYHRV